jgi:hypothetical protein
MLSSVSRLTLRAIRSLAAATDADENRGVLDGDGPAPLEGDASPDAGSDAVVADKPEATVNDGGEAKSSSKKKQANENSDDLDGLWEGDSEGEGNGGVTTQPRSTWKSPRRKSDNRDETGDSANDGVGGKLKSFGSDRNSDDLEGDDPGSIEGERGHTKDNDSVAEGPTSDTLGQDKGGRKKLRRSSRSSSQVTPAASNGVQGEVQLVEAVTSNPNAASQNGGGRKLRSSPRLSALQVRSSQRVNTKATEGNRNVRAKGSTTDQVASVRNAAKPDAAEMNLKEDGEEVDVDTGRKIGHLPGPGWTRGTFR